MKQCTVICILTCYRNALSCSFRDVLTVFSNKTAHFLLFSNVLWQSLNTQLLNNWPSCSPEGERTFVSWSVAKMFHRDCGAFRSIYRWNPNWLFLEGFSSSYGTWQWLNTGISFIPTDAFICITNKWWETRIIEEVTIVCFELQYQIHVKVLHIPYTSQKVSYKTQLSLRHV
jgi:hypothetical protein